MKKEGIVIKSTGSWYKVLTDDNSVLEARIRGKIRLKGSKTTNPVAVGDRVLYIEDQNSCIIEEIKPRENYIIRKSVKKSSQAHIIASNIDQALLIATMSHPATSNGFIDRFLISAESFRIPQIILFNKQDLLNEDELKIQNNLIKIYSGIGVYCHKISAIDIESSKFLKEIFENKTTLIAGHSGVGKSTLLNSLFPGLDLKTSDVSDFANKGVHTTTFAEMHMPDKNHRIIDTPGIKELGLFDMEEYELSDYFPEMREVRQDCKFNNCLHTNEPGCAVKKAVENGIITATRYNSYLSMLLNEDNRN